MNRGGSEDEQTTRNTEASDDRYSRKLSRTANYFHITAVHFVVVTLHDEPGGHSVRCFPVVIRVQQFAPAKVPGRSAILNVTSVTVVSSKIPGKTRQGVRASSVYDASHFE